MTKIMGILNATPDSFFSGSRVDEGETALKRAQKMVLDGADILDIGGESTRPGAEFVSIEVELQRVIPILKAIQGQISIPISIDTRRPEVARRAIELGASIINDVGGFQDKEMRIVAAESGSQVVSMHMLGTPVSMQQQIAYPRGVVNEVLDFFKRRVDELLRDGILEKNIILDPGIGFGKTVQDNVDLVKNVEALRSLGFPLLYGTSRKNFIRTIADASIEEAVFPTLAVDTILLLQRVDIIRVHDVKEHSQIRKIVRYFA